MIAFHEEFNPVSGVDYGWVLARAKESFAHIDKAMEQVDAKASALINYFGGGAGVLAFVTTAVILGLAAATAPWWGEAFGFGGAWDVVWLTLAWSTPAALVLMMATLLLAENRLRPRTRPDA